MPRRVTSDDVAERAGVSRTTVSLVLNGRAGSIPEATRHRVHEVAARLGYRPNATARALARGRTDVFGIVVYEDPYADRASYSVLRSLLENLLHAVLRTGRNPMLFANLAGRSIDLAAYGDGRADAFLLLAPRDEDPLVAYLAANRVPFVALARRVDTAGAGSWIDIDNDHGVVAAVEHLMSAGHRRIAHLAGQRENPAARTRREAFYREMRQCGLPVPEAYVLEGRFTARGGEEAATDLLSLPERPTAIFAGNDNMAMGAYRAARRLGLRVPDDLSLVGFDDAEYAPALDPPLTTVRFPRPEMAEGAAELLTDLIHHPERPHRPRVLPTELVLRSSVAPPHP
jgi:LacI family transcriptional regulator, galactose operon repressor